MATHTYTNLKQRYDNFHHPVIVLKVNGKDFAKNKAGLTVTDIEIELTSGFEASVASFSLYNTFDPDHSCFRISEIKEYILLGSSVDIALGYEKAAQTVFRGYISRVNFLYEEGDMPGIRVTAMDVKGAMMANNYSKQIAYTSYGDAVRELFNKPPYMSLTSAEIIDKVIVTDTPDKILPPPQVSDRTLEMVAESDYEFVVKAAKKYNYEFFTECGNVYFRPAKSNTEIVMEMGPGEGLRYFDVEYDITGLVETVMARGTDVGRAKLIEAKKKMNNKVSIGNKAKKIIKKSEKVYLDASIHSKQEAERRVDSLIEEISYRFGTMECVCIGLPELLPGKFFVLTSLGVPPENKFYLYRVVHKMNQEDGFTTKLYGKADSIQQTELGGIAGGLI